MKYYKNNRGPFPLGVYFEEDEIESAAFEQIQNAKLFPSDARHFVDVDRLLKSNFGIEADYEDLEGDVLGKSEFYKDGTIRVIISRPLANESNGSKENLYRTTLAHEIGHLVLHRILFMEDTLKLQGISDLKSDVYPVLCRSDASGNGIKEYSGEWWEWQANCFMSAVLLPKYYIVKLCGDLRANNPDLATKELRLLAESNIASSMKVSRQACAIRLAQLNLFQTSEDQIELAI